MLEKGRMQSEEKSTDYVGFREMSNIVRRQAFSRGAQMHFFYVLIQTAVRVVYVCFM